MIRVLVDGGRWQTLGAERDRYVEPTGIAPTWDAWGPAALNFSLGRDPSLTHPDLAAFTPIEYLPYGRAGEAAWGGYIIDTPAAGDQGLGVSCKGWQYALDDDPFTDAYVHENLADWQDLRSLPSSFLYNGAAGWTAAGQVQVGAGEITLSRAQGTVMKQGGAHGVYLDMGPSGRGCKALSFDVTIPAGWSVAYGLYARASDTPSGQHLGPVIHDGGISPITPAVGSNTYTAVFDRPYRYVSIFLYVPGATVTTTVEEILQITGARAFSADAYRAGGASTLRATHIWQNALTKVPALDQDTSLIDQTAFTLRGFGGVKQKRTARSEIEQANTYHRWITRVRADRRLEARQRFAYATLEANTRRPGVDWQDASSSSGEDVYNKVVITGRSGSGQELEVVRTTTQLGVRNVLDRRGRTRSKELQVQAPTDVTIMAALGDVYLTRYGRTPLKGTLTISGPDALRSIGTGGTGGSIAPGYVGSRTGEAVLLSNLFDPDTGDRGRIAITAGCNYSEESDVATLAIDNTRDDIEAVFARMGVLAAN